VRLEALLAKEGKEVDARVLEDLDAMRPKDAEAVLARLAEANLAKVRHGSACSAPGGRRASHGRHASCPARAFLTRMLLSRLDHAPH
jgi:hypothetical protein